MTKKKIAARATIKDRVFQGEKGRIGGRGSFRHFREKEGKDIKMAWTAGIRDAGLGKNVKKSQDWESEKVAKSSS